MRKYLIAAGLLFAAFCGNATAQEGLKFDVTPGFKIAPAEKKIEIAFPPKAKKPGNCGCGDDCLCPVCDGNCVDSKVKAASTVDPWYACQISVARAPGVTAYGSGTPLATENGKTVVLTNAHVVRDNTKPITVHLNGKQYPAKYVLGSVVTDVGPQQIHVDGPDLCVLEVDADLWGVDLAADIPAVGEPVFQMGYGGSTNGKPIKRTGVVIQPVYAGQLNSTITAVSGDSGCGVFNKYGQLVGVTHGGTQTVALAETVTTVRTYVLKGDKKFVLFPRLRARLEANREARADRNVDPEFSGKAPVAAAPLPEGVVGAPFGSGVPPKPPGEGWQWDAAKKQWWKWTVPPGYSLPNQAPAKPQTSIGQPYFTPGTFNIAPAQGGCPNGRCPSPTAPSRRW